MYNKVEVENAILGISEINNIVRFIDSHAYDIQSTDEAVSMLHIIAGQLDIRTKNLASAFYGGHAEKG